MAVLYVTEYSKQGFDNFFRNVAINAAMEPPVANQVVAIGGGRHLGHLHRGQRQCSRA